MVVLRPAFLVRCTHVPGFLDSVIARGYGGHRRCSATAGTGEHGATLGGDKGYDTAAFVAGCGS